jgi:hypothetical protein
VDDGQQGDRAGLRRGGARRCLERLKLAAGRAVDDIPSAVSQLLANRVRGGEVVLAPAGYPFLEKPFCFLSVQK